MLTSSDARRFSSVVLPALSSPSRTMRSSCSCSGEPFSFWMTESSPWGQGVLGEPCGVPGGCRAPLFGRGKLGTLLALGTLCLWPERASRLGSQSVQARGGPTADLPSLNSALLRCAVPALRPLPAPVGTCPRQSPALPALLAPPLRAGAALPAAAAAGGMSADPAYLLHITHGPGVAPARGTAWGAARGSSLGPAGGFVTGTLPVPGGGRGLRAPELAAVPPFTHSIK